MKIVYCIGEALLDIIFKNGQPVHATPGGSMLNSAVSLGRVHIPVHLISDYGRDQAGDLINDYLSRNGVSTAFANRYSIGKTAIALAFLDKAQNANYSFYKEYPAERFPQHLPVIHPGDVVLFGSFYSISDSLHMEVAAFVRQARASGAFIMYDPNFRKPHLPDIDRLRPRIVENIGLSDLVRGSDEDFSLIFNAPNFEQALTAVNKAGCCALVYTRNKDGVTAAFRDERYHSAVPVIDPVSTIGAGDAFNAGMIYAMMTRPGLNVSGPEHMLQTGIRFSSEVCSSFENCISTGFAFKLKNMYHSS